MLLCFDNIAADPTISYKVGFLSFKMLEMQMGNAKLISLLFHIKQLTGRNSCEWKIVSNQCLSTTKADAELFRNLHNCEGLMAFDNENDVHFQHGLSHP
ncbi:hypothetical protein Trydic_g4673 [Trypoxylus dichotomus]